MDKEVTDYGHTDSGAPYVPQRNQTIREKNGKEKKIPAGLRSSERK